MGVYLVNPFDGFAQIIGTLPDIRLLVFERIQPVVHRLELVPRLAVGLQQRSITSVGVKHLTLAGGRSDTQLVRLPVDGHQMLRHMLQHRTRHGMPRKHRTRPTSHRHCARQVQFAFIRGGIDARVFGLNDGRIVFSDREYALRPRFLGSRADTPRLGGTTGNQADRAQQHGFAGTRLTGDGGHTPRRCDARVVNRPQIAYLKFLKHQRASSPAVSSPVVWCVCRVRLCSRQPTTGRSNFVTKR